MAQVLPELFLHNKWRGQCLIAQHSRLFTQAIGTKSRFPKNFQQPLSKITNPMSQSNQIITW
jgi:hypothetical protein